MRFPKRMSFRGKFPVVCGPAQHAARPAESGDRAQPVVDHLSAAAWPKDAWWTGFGDAQLDRLMQEALQGQPKLRIAVARVRQAQALTEVAGAAGERWRQEHAAALQRARHRPAPKKLFVAGILALAVFGALLARVNVEANLWLNILPALACYGIFVLTSAIAVPGLIGIAVTLAQQVLR